MNSVTLHGIDLSHCFTKHQSYIPQCTILKQKYARVCTFLLQNDALWDVWCIICQMVNMRKNYQWVLLYRSPFYIYIYILVILWLAVRCLSFTFANVDDIFVYFQVRLIPAIITEASTVSYIYLSSAHLGSRVLSCPVPSVCLSVHLSHAQYHSIVHRI